MKTIDQSQWNRIAARAALMDQNGYSLASIILAESTKQLISDWGVESRVSLAPNDIRIVVVCQIQPARNSKSTAEHICRNDDFKAPDGA